MTTLTSVAAVAAAQTLANMTKSSQMYSTTASQQSDSNKTTVQNDTPSEDTNINVMNGSSLSTISSLSPKHSQLFSTLTSNVKVLSEQKSDDGELKDGTITKKNSSANVALPATNNTESKNGEKLSKSDKKNKDQGQNIEKHNVVSTGKFFHSLKLTCILYHKNHRIIICYDCLFKILYVHVSELDRCTSPVDKNMDIESSAPTALNTLSGTKDNKEPLDSVDQNDSISGTSILSLNNNNTISTSKHLASVSSLHPSVTSSLTMEEAKQLMLSQYIPWVNSTYGDTAKTKTITKKKYSRIIALLRFNAEQKESKNNNSPTLNSTTDTNTSSSLALVGTNGGSELAKFKLWVKSKGFHLGPPEGHPDFGTPDTEKTLYLPTGTDKVSDFYLLASF